MEKRCSGCDSVKDESEFYRNKSTADGLRYCCKVCSLKLSVEWNNSNRVRVRELSKAGYRRHHVIRRVIDQWSKRGSPGYHLYSQYKGSAKARGIEFKLTREEFYSFWQKPCFYTGRKMEKIGLDRVDNNKGYEIGNVVSCCTEVNMAKKAASFDKFLKMCIDVSETHKKASVHTDLQA